MWPQNSLYQTHSDSFPYKVQRHSFEEWTFSINGLPFPLDAHESVFTLFFKCYSFTLAFIYSYNYLVVELCLSLLQHPRRNRQVCIWYNLSYLCLKILETFCRVLVLPVSKGASFFLHSSLLLRDEPSHQHPKMTCMSANRTPSTIQGLFLSVGTHWCLWLDLTIMWREGKEPAIMHQDTAWQDALLTAPA